jgi:hypothetical protein
MGEGVTGWAQEFDPQRLGVVGMVAMQITRLAAPRARIRQRDVALGYRPVYPRLRDTMRGSERARNSGGRDPVAAGLRGGRAERPDRPGGEGAPNPFGASLTRQKVVFHQIGDAPGP